MRREEILKITKFISDNLEKPEPVEPYVPPVEKLPSWQVNPNGHVWTKTSKGEYIPECISCGSYFCEDDELERCPNDDLCYSDKMSFRYAWKIKCPKCGGGVSRRICHVGPTGTAGGKRIDVGHFICMKCKAEFSRRKETTEIIKDGIMRRLTEDTTISEWSPLVLRKGKYCTLGGAREEEYKDEHGEYRDYGPIG